MFSGIKLRLEALRGRLEKRLLGKRAIGVLTENEQGLYVVDPEDRIVGKRLRKRGAYGEDELALILPLLSPDSNALVVGAHIGSLAIPMARRCKSLVAFEANPTTYRLLAANVALNGSSNLQAHNLAANDRPGSLAFLASRANSGGSKRVPKIKDRMYYYDAPHEIYVESVRLDDFLPGRTFDVILMDIEGSEYFALQGMPRILKSCKALIVEFVPHHLKNVAGVSVAQFLAVLPPHLDTLFLPSLNRTVDKADFQATLQGLVDRNQSDEGIVFTAGGPAAR